MGVLDGKVAVVTGGGKGLGKCIALAYAKEGAAVAVMARTYEMVAETANTIKRDGGRALAVQCDVSQRPQVNAAVAATVKEFGAVNILVNAARQPYRDAPFEELTEEDLAINMGSSFMGTWHFMQACFPYLKERGGKVINFTSAAYTAGVKQKAAYAAAKGAVRGLTSVACLEWAQFKINVNIISPFARTEGWDAHLRQYPPGTEEQFLAGIPLGRIGDPDKDLARVAVFLAGPDSDFITGSTICVDGGSSTFRL